MAAPRVLDLFSGIGGFSLGLERAGMRTAAFCEIDPFCQKVLRKHWPDIPRYGDVTDLTAERLKQDGIEADVICGGFPCQDLSHAQQRGARGLDGERSGLWREYARLVGEIRPRHVVVENVPALADRGLGRVLGQLSEIGYDAEWGIISAGQLGLAHERKRLWIVAYPARDGRRGVDKDSEGRRPRLDISRHLAQVGQERRAERRRGPADILQPVGRPFASPSRGIGRNDDGLPAGVDRLRAIGNAVVPRIAEALGRAILEGMEGEGA